MKVIQYIHRGFIWLMILPIKFYKYSISPLLPNSCRHVPTCSEYAIESLQVHGIFKGSALAIWRIFGAIRGEHTGMTRCPQKAKKGLTGFFYFQTCLIGQKAKDGKEQCTVGHVKIVYRMPQSEKDLS